MGKLSAAIRAYSKTETGEALSHVASTTPLTMPHLAEGKPIQRHLSNDMNTHRQARAMLRLVHLSKLQSARTHGNRSKALLLFATLAESGNYQPAVCDYGAATDKGRAATKQEIGIRFSLPFHAVTHASRLACRVSRGKGVFIRAGALCVCLCEHL